MALRERWRRRRSGGAPAEAAIGGAVRPPVDRRGLAKSGTLGAAVLLALALTVIVNYFGWKYHQRLDWTESEFYSLSERTGQVLAEVDEDVVVTVFLDPGDELFEPARELLERYAAASPRVSVRVMDPERNPLEARQLAAEYQLDRPAVVFAAGEERRVVPATDLAEYDFSGAQMGGAPEIRSFRGEQQFTRAVLELTEGEKPKMVFTVGHGEISLDDRSGTGLQELQRLLGADSFTFEEWASLGAGEVPADTDVLVIAGPTSTFLPPELDLLAAYLDGGGRLLALLDPPLAGGADSRVGEIGLEAWLAGYGVALGANVVVDSGASLPFFGAETFFASRYPDAHPINRSLRDGALPVLIRLARSVGEAGPPPGYRSATLLTSLAEAWGETDLSAPALDADDLAGPVPLGVVVEPGEADDEDDFGGAGLLDEEPAADGEEEPGDGFRLVVFGDSDLATDQFLGQNFGNQVLLSGAVNWLVERHALVGIPPRETERVGLSLTAGEIRALYLLVLLVLPGLGLAAGLFVHFRRRR
ncbi:MAG TPA: GldG family protein [Thermoanaerobaculia bacterium]|nr:GldG family protein [Thermoanaerobaculia bacterium]